MNNTIFSKHIEAAKRVFEIESKAVSDLSHQLDNQFAEVVELILRNSGRVIICGIGKSGIIGQKISATLSSTGTSSFFLHPVEAFHGDLGMVTKEDIFIGISYSGETEELLKLIPYIKNRGVPSICITGNVHSTLAMNCDFILKVKIEKEACPLELAPTSSTTSTLAMGDALSIALMNARGFNEENFAQFHPGGTLGKRLLTTVENCMVKDNLPIISASTPLKEVISAINLGRLGLAIVVDERTIVGIITDGDIRRAIDAHSEHFFTLCASKIMTFTPKTITKDMKMAEAEQCMTQYKITSLIVEENNYPIGVIQIYNVSI